MSQIGLAATVSLVRPDLAVTIKVSEIMGRWLSCFLCGGSQHEIFALTMDLNLASLRTGYYAIIGSHSDEGWPASLAIDANGRLTDSTGCTLSRHSCAVVDVLALPRRGPEIARDEPWCELLQAGKEQVLDAHPADEQERRKLLNEWRSTLVRKECGDLLAEISEVVLKAQVEVEEKLFARVLEADLELPEDLQTLLEVRTEQELRQSVQDYQNALDVSSRLMKQYGLEE